MAEETVLRCDQLTKRYKRGKPAVDCLTFGVQAGQVYGFLGQNGAGKTTTILMMLDLVRPTSGNVSLFGKAPRHERIVLRRVGALVEGAAFYPYLSGQANLELLSRMHPGK